MPIAIMQLERRDPLVGRDAMECAAHRIRLENICDCTLKQAQEWLRCHHLRPHTVLHFPTFWRSLLFFLSLKLGHVSSVYLV